MKAQRSQLKSVLTAAIVDFCQKQDLFIAELHIQGTVCITTDSTSTLVTQISEKVCGNGGSQCDNDPEAVSEIGQALESSGILARLREAKHDRLPQEAVVGESRHRRQSEYSHALSRRPAPSVGRQRHHSDRCDILQRYPGTTGLSEPYRDSTVLPEQYRDSTHRTQEEHREYRTRAPSGGSLENRAYVSLKQEPDDAASRGEGSDVEDGRQTVYEHRRMGDSRPIDDIKPDVSSAAMAVYSYIRSPTYQTAGEGHLGQGYPGVRGHTSSPGHNREQFVDSRHSNVTPSSSVSSPTCTISVNPSATYTMSESMSSKVALTEQFMRPGPPTSVSESAYYSLPMSSSHMSLRLPVDLSSRLLPLSSPTSIKSEPLRQLQIVTQPSGQAVPSLVSPSAQAAASAMAALSGLQAAIMPGSPQRTASSPTTTVSTATTSGVGGQEGESMSPPVNQGQQLAQTTVASLQMLDTPVNSHFRKMMLKSLQGKYKVLKTPEGRYKCPVCGASYLYQPNLRKHLEKAHLGKSYKCEFCGQKFTSVQGYSFHRKVKHRDLMPYRCELCRDAFYSYTAFLQHKKRTHSNQPGCVAIAQALPPSPRVSQDDSP